MNRWRCERGNPICRLGSCTPCQRARGCVRGEGRFRIFTAISAPCCEQEGAGNPFARLLERPQSCPLSHGVPQRRDDADFRSHRAARHRCRSAVPGLARRSADDGHCAPRKHRGLDAACADPRAPEQRAKIRRHHSRKRAARRLFPGQPRRSAGVAALPAPTGPGQADACGRQLCDTRQWQECKELAAPDCCA